MDLYAYIIFKNPHTWLVGKMMGAPWDGGPLIINPIHTLYSKYLLGISPLKGSKRGGLNSWGPPSQGFSHHFPYDWPVMKGG